MKYIAFVLLMLNISTVRSQQLFEGKVVVEETREPLWGARLIILENGLQSVTDVNGAFRFSDIKSGKYTIEIAYLGYEKVSDTIVVRTDVNKIYFLKPGAIALNDVIIYGNAERTLNTFSQVDFKLRPTNSSQDILRMIPGLFIAQHAGGGKAEQIFLRGFDIDHGTDINLSVDGLPVNMVSHAHGQGYSDLHFVIPEFINHVDFDKGPYFADKGDFATAGFVSFHTKNYLEKNFIKKEVGQFGTWRGVGGVNLFSPKTSKTSGYVGAEFLGMDGYFESPQDLNRINVISKINSKVTDNDDLTIHASYFRSKWDASGQIPERAVASGMIRRFGYIDNTEGGETSRANLSLKHIHEFRDAYLIHQLYTVYYDFNLFSNFTFFLNDSVNGDQINQREGRMIYGYSASFNKTHRLFQKTTRTEIGGGFRLDDINDIALSSSVKRNVLEDRKRGDISEVNANIYITETMDLSDHLSVNAAVRVDNFYFRYFDKLSVTTQSRSKTIVSPKLNLAYNLNTATQIYMRTGRGFHSNDARVSSMRISGNVLPSALGFDLGVNTKLNEQIMLNAAVWMLDMQQEFVYVGDEGIVEAGGKTQRKGVDLSIRYQVSPWLFIDGDINITKPRYKELGEGVNHVPLAPLLSSVGGVTTKFGNGFEGSIRYRYLDDRPANEDFSVTAKGYFLADAVVNYSSRKYEVGMSIENIFNTKWYEAQFDTESRLKDEANPVSEIHFTPGSPLFFKLRVGYFF